MSEQFFSSSGGQVIPVGVNVMLPSEFELHMPSQPFLQPMLPLRADPPDDHGPVPV
jgi:hypothetical protein